MTEPTTKIIEHLNVARATELALVQTLTAHIAITPHGSYRDALDEHVEVTRSHAEQVQARLEALGESRGPLQVGVGLIESVVGQALALSKGPIDLLRGTSAEEKLLRNARDECATEAFEIGLYAALGEVARALGDERTAKLADSHLEQEQEMLDRLREEIAGLARAVVRAEVSGVPAFDPTTTGAADAAKAAGRAARETAGAAGDKAKASARSVPGVAQAEGEARGAVASEEDLPISGYDSLNATDVVSALPRLSQIELGLLDAYERRHQNRATVLERIDSLRGSEPWPGYDEQTVEEVVSKLSDGGDDAASVRDYEGRHKDRNGVLEAAEREAARA